MNQSISTSLITLYQSLDRLPTRINSKKSCLLCRIQLKKTCSWRKLILTHLTKCFVSESTRFQPKPFKRSASLFCREAVPLTTRLSVDRWRDHDSGELRCLYGFGVNSIVTKHTNYFAFKIRQSSRCGVVTTTLDKEQHNCCVRKPIFLEGVQQKNGSNPPDMLSACPGVAVNVKLENMSKKSSKYSF